MVGAVELKADDVSDGSVDLVVLVDELAVTANDDSVDSASSGSSCCCRWRRGRGSGWWWGRWRSAWCAGRLGTGDRGGDGLCLAVDDRNADVDDDNRDFGLFIDCNDAILAWSIASGVDPDGGLGPTVVYGSDCGAGSSDIWRGLVGRAAISNRCIRLRNFVLVRGSDSDS